MSTFERLTLPIGGHGEGLEVSALAAGDGPLVLCLHGFPDHNATFRHQLPALAAAGYRAVAPMLRGYEPASQPSRRHRDYHPTHAAEDALSLATELAGDGEAHIVGHDWGALVAYLACGLDPSRFHSATTIAVPAPQRLGGSVRLLPGQLRKSWYMFFFQARGVAERALAARDFALVDRLWHDWSPGWEPGSEETAALKATLRQPGVARAALAYYRAMFDPLASESRRCAAVLGRPIETPTLAITGAEDGCIDTRLYDTVMDAGRFGGGLRVERLDGCGHFAHQERPDEVNELLLAWLTAHRPADAGTNGR